MSKDTWEEVDYYPDENEQKALQKDFEFEDFKTALDFVNKVGHLAEQAQHHPGINLNWGYVRIWLTTHSEKKITRKDHELAKTIDQIEL